MWLKKQHLEPYMEHLTGSKLRKECNKAVYCPFNARLYELQAGIKTARRNINLRYADDTTLMAENEEELKSLLKVKEESGKAGLKQLIHVNVWQNPSN